MTLIAKLEEALLDRDGSIKREQNLLKEIHTLNDKCAQLPKVYHDKNEQSVNALRAQFTADRRRFCEETGKLEELVASLQGQLDRAIREKRYRQLFF